MTSFIFLPPACRKVRTCCWKIVNGVNNHIASKCGHNLTINVMVLKLSIAFEKYLPIYWVYLKHWGAWMSNYFPKFYVLVISYPYFIFNIIFLISVCKRGWWNFIHIHWDMQGSARGCLANLLWSELTCLEKLSCSSIIAGTFTQSTDNKGHLHSK